jgi:hypothetical protein
MILISMDSNVLNGEYGINGKGLIKLGLIED